MRRQDSIHTERKRRGGFTLIELVMVILLLAILAAIAIPNFIDFRREAKNAAAHGALGALRAAIAVATASIALKEDPELNPPRYPTILEMQVNAFDGSHPNLKALGGVYSNIMDDATGVPRNPWSLMTVPARMWSSMWDCQVTKSFVRSAVGEMDFGWCYNEDTGQVWTNSRRNQATNEFDRENFY